MKYLLDLMTGLDWHPGLVDSLTFILFFGALFVSVTLNIRDWKRKKKTGSATAD